MSQTYKRIAVGGTFDRLHEGHKALLRKSADVTTERLTIGITGIVDCNYSISFPEYFNCNSG